LIYNYSLINHIELKFDGAVVRAAGAFNLVSTKRDMQNYVIIIIIQIELFVICYKYPHCHNFGEKGIGCIERNCALLGFLHLLYLLPLTFKRRHAYKPSACLLMARRLNAIKHP
jgi:hypothetical protein